MLCRFPSLSPPGDHFPSSVQYFATPTFAAHHVISITALDTSLSDYIPYYYATTQPINWAYTIEKLEQKQSMMKSARAEKERQCMKMIRVYRNAHCAKCARFARAGLFFDWLDRMDASTETPKTGPLRLGEVVVEELSSGRILKGAEGIELIFRNIPAYAPFLMLFRVPSFRRYIAKEVSGCEGNACEISSKPQPAVDQSKKTR